MPKVEPVRIPQSTCVYVALTKNVTSFDDPEGAMTLAPLLDYAPRQVCSGAINARLADSRCGRALPEKTTNFGSRQDLVYDQTWPTLQ